MANPFDQFDAPSSPSGAANPFDKFDAPTAKPVGFVRKAADLGLGFASGALGATKSVADVAGAGNAVSGALDTADKFVQSGLSDQAIADQQEQQAILKESQGKGIVEGVKSAGRAFAVAPVQTAVTGLGSVIPTIAAGLATGGASVPVSLGAMAAMGAAQGAGSIKGGIYDDIKQRSAEAKMDPAAAEAAAIKAQEYAGPNTGQIALGAALGLGDSVTGVSKVATSMIRKGLGKGAQELAEGSTRGFVARTALGAAGEVPLEAAQGGQQQYASNVASQREGFAVNPWDNVVSQGAFEGLASAGPGAAFGALHGKAAPAPGQDPQAPVAPGAPAPEPTPPGLGFNPTAGTTTVFPDGTTILNSESANGEQAVFDKRFAPQAGTAAAQDAPAADSFASILDTDPVYSTWSNVQDGTDRDIMRNQMEYVGRTYAGKVTDENRDAITKEMSQQFKWFRNAAPEQRNAALNSLFAQPAAAPADQPNLMAAAQADAEANIERTRAAWVEAARVRDNRIAKVGVAEAPANSPLTSAAFVAVDTGAHDEAIAQQNQALTQAGQAQAATEKGVPSDATLTVAADIGIPTSEPIPPNSTELKPGAPVAAPAAPTPQERIATLESELQTRKDAVNGSTIGIPQMVAKRREITALTAQIQQPESVNAQPESAAPTQAAPTQAPAAAGIDAAQPAAAGATSGAGSLEAAGIARAPMTPVAASQSIEGAPINKEWSAFTPESGTLSVPRADMPQIKSEARGAMVNFLKARGIASEPGEVPADSLKPTQAEFSPAKVEQAKGFMGGDRSILVSSDGHVLDGHHQWLAKREAGASVKVIRLDAPIADLLPIVKEFPSATQAPQAQAAIESVASTPEGTTNEPQANQAITQQAGPEASAAPVAGPADQVTLNPIQAAAVAKQKGIDTTGMKPAQVVAAIAQADAAPAGPVQLGRNNTPLSEGGKPYKTRLAASDAKKLQPMMRVVAVKDGYALADKTEKMLAAEAKNARRLSNPQTSPVGEPIPAHAFIANEGGLHKDTRPDMNIGANPKVGNRTLFAGKGKGISMERATARLIEEGYLSEGASHNEAAALIKKSLTNPQYNPDGVERMALAEEEARYAAYELEMENGIVEIEALDDNEAAFLDDSDIPFGDEPSNVTLEAAMSALGFTEQEVKNETNANRSRITPADSEGLRSPVETAASDAQAGDGQRAPASEQEQGGLTAPSEQDILDKQDREESVDRAAKAKRRADDELARLERVRKDIAKASEVAANSFVLGGDAELNLSGQGGMFDDAPASAPSMFDEPAPATPKAEAAPAAQPNKPASAKIADFGEKIGGAKKDIWTSFKDNLNSVKDEDIAAQSLSKIWPAPDYQQLIDGGMESEAIGLIRAFRDEIPSKPRQGYKVKRWAEQVKTLRELANSLMDGKTVADRVRLEMADGSDAMRGMFGRAELYQEVGHKKSLEGIRLAWHSYSFYKGEKNVSLWVVERDAAATAFSNWPQELATGKTKEEAIAGFKARYDTLDTEKAVKQASFDVITERGKQGYFIGKKVGRNHATLAGPFTTVKEARDYRTANFAELQAKLEKFKEIPRERRDTNEPRVGEDMRNGQDVTPEFFGQTFGFKGVEFGNWVEQGRRQKDLNSAFDALMDMAAVLGIPPKAISLDGKLGLAFGARGNGGVSPAAAHYEPGLVVINLTKKEGAGSLGHEWWHALDNYFSKQRGKGGYMTTAVDVGLSSRGSNYVPYAGVRKEMIDAFGAVVKAINQTAMKARSSKLDSKRSKEYWGTGEELSARAFESYLIAKLQDQYGANDYLANVVSEKAWDAMASMGMENENSYPYPTADEIPAIRAGFDHLFNTVQTKEGDAGNVAMFSRPTQDQASTGTAKTVRAALAKRFGLTIVQMEKRGFLKIWDTTAQFNESGQSSRQIEGAAQGMWDGKVAHLFADGIEQGNEVAVMLHEVGEHASMQKMLGPEAYKRLVARAHELMRADDPTALEAVMRIPDDTPEKFLNSELLAYMIEIVAAQDAKASPGARKWLADVVAAIRAWWSQTGAALKLRDYGIRMELTPKDIAALAVQAVKWQGQQGMELAPVGVPAFSRGDDAVRAGDVFRAPTGEAVTVMRALPGGKVEVRIQGKRLRLADFKNNNLKAWPKIGRADYADGFYTTPQSLIDLARNEPAALDSEIPMFSRPALAKSISDALSAATVTDVKAKAGNKLADYRNLGLQFLGGRQLNDLYAKDIPQLPEYTRMVQQMSADSNEVGANADAVATSWGSLKDERQLAELMHDATLAQIDPDKPAPATPATKGREAFAGLHEASEHRKLKARFDALTPEAKKVYRDARDGYLKHFASVRQAIREKVERSAMNSAAKAAMLERMDAEFFGHIKGVYFPLARFGPYVVVTRNPAGEVVNVSRAESLNEAETLRAAMRKAYPGFAVGKVLKDKEFNAARDSVGRGFLKDLFGVLDKQGIGEELQDAVNQLYLASMPDLSWAKHGLHRKGTPGFSQDARRAYAQNMFHGARYLAKLRYADQLQEKLQDMQGHVEAQAGNEAYDSVKGQQIVDEMNKRNDSLMNPKSNPLSTALTSFGFVFHLGLSPASAMVNLSQTALVAYPIMGAKWGFDKAAAALAVAGKQAASNKNDISSTLNADERRAYDAAVNAGTIDVTNAHDLAGIAQGEDSGIMWKVRPIMKWASFLFHHAERFNRQITFVASYRLARAAGTAHEAAFEQATKATYDGHFDYAASNRPRVMQGNVAKVLLLFRQFGQNMVYTLTRQAQLAIKAETPEGRKEARKALGGLLVMHAAGAGVLGLPLVTTLLAAASMLGSDDDEPWDAEDALRNTLAETFGQKPAEVMARGLSRLTPWDISGRVGLDKLIFPDVQEGLAGQRWAESAMTSALGPVAGIGVNMLKGMQEIAGGNYARGLESMMPAALRGPLKALRYEQEGNVDRTGVVINDEVSAAGVLGQAMGFSPSETRNATEGRSAIFSADKRLGERRAELMGQFAKAYMRKDEEATAEARAEISQFNEKNPSRRINGIQMMQSVRGRQKRIDESKDGVYLPKNRQDARAAGNFSLAE